MWAFVCYGCSNIMFILCKEWQQEQKGSTLIKIQVIWRKLGASNLAKSEKLLCPGTDSLASGGRSSNSLCLRKEARSEKHHYTRN